MTKTNPVILIVEDESAIRELLEYSLERAGFTVQQAADARQAQDLIEQNLPDMLVLDWMLPGISGVDLANKLRQAPRTRQLPIIMLTARGEEEAKIRGLSAGADDYVTKPFSPQELIARIRAVMRRSNVGQEQSVIQFEKLSLDMLGHRVTAHGKSVEIGPTEFRLLHFFMTHPERVFSRSQLLDWVWGQQVYIEERTIDVHIRRLRKALAVHGCEGYIQTVRGSGYRFSQQVAPH